MKFLKGVAVPLIATALALTQGVQSQSIISNLEPDHSIERELAGGQVHAYSFALTAGQYLRISVAQKGINVVVRLAGPDGKPITEVNNQNNALLPEQLSALTEHYQIRKGDPERIAGFDSNALVLEPRDGMRYGHKFWAEKTSGLLLKARMVNERHNVVEQFSFTHLAIGGGISREMVKPSFSVSFPEWRVDRFAHNLTTNVESGWAVKNFPAGFRKIMEMRRNKLGNSIPVTHLVFSDGLAAVSVFIEPMANRTRINEGLSHQGAINIYTRTINDQVVTVLGEAPASTVMQIANSVSFRGK